MDRYQISKNIIEKDMFEEKILLDLNTGNYHSLNESAAFIWNLIRQRRSQEQIHTDYTTEYQIDKTQAQADISETIQYFLSEGFIVT